MILLYIILAIILIPMIVVAIGLPFAKPVRWIEFTLHKKPLSGVYQLQLPNWLKWFSNPEDGLTGDVRGWYVNEYFPAWVPMWFKMWWWSGVRNPYNYLKRITFGVDIRKFTFHKLIGDDYVRDDFDNTGFQILYAKPKNGWFPRPMLYWVRRWGKTDRGIVVQIGWKIKLDHNTDVEAVEWDNFKGCTFEPNPYKDIS